MSFTINEVGKDHNVNASFDMTNFTELTLNYIDSNGVAITKTTADGIVLGIVNIIDPDVGPMIANEYVVYNTEAGFLSVAGTWKVSLQYDNSATPVTYVGKCDTFEVDATCS